MTQIHSTYQLMNTLLEVYDLLLNI